MSQTVFRALEPLTIHNKLKVQLLFNKCWPHFLKNLYLTKVKFNKYRTTDLLPRYRFFYIIPFFCTHRVVGGLDAAEGGTFLHHEAEQTCEDGGDRPRRVPSVWMEVCDG